MTKTTTTTTAPETFTALEIAYRLPGTSTWKRRIVKTQAAATRLYDRLGAESAEIYVRTAD